MLPGHSLRRGTDLSVSKRLATDFLASCDEVCRPGAGAGQGDGLVRDAPMARPWKVRR